MINPTLAPLPAAWMGYAVTRGDRACVRVCAYCPDKAEAERIADEAGHSTTHGACKFCAYKLNAAFCGEPDP